MTAIDFEKGFNAYVGAHQKVWKHDRTKSVGASESFGCIRKSWFTKNNAVKDFDHKESWGALQRGDLIENHFVEPATRWFIENLHDAELVWGGAKQRTLIDGNLSATPDGLIINVDDDALAMYGIESLGGAGCFNFEVKSIDPRVNLKEEKAIHRGQVQVQMGLTRLKTRYKPNYAVIIYVDASFYDDIDIFVVPYDQHAFNIAKERADTVFATKDPVELMPEGKIDGTCDYCPYKRVCAQTNKINTPQDGDANTNETPLAIIEEFVSLATDERAAYLEKKVAEATHKEFSERIKQWFRETGVKRVKAPDDSIKGSISWVKGRKSYDVEAMRADGIDVEKYSKMGEGGDRLTISEKGSTRADEE